MVWDWTVSRCICVLQGTDSGMDTPSREFKAEHPIQSYEIVRRCRAGSSVLPILGADLASHLELAAELVAG